jgi:uncharacterized protein (TIGR02145 family)
MKKNNLIITLLAVTITFLCSGYRFISASCKVSIGVVRNPLEAVSVVTIGSQVWTNKNLDIVTYRNGDIIPQVQDKNAWANLTTGAWCYADNDESNGSKYGKLYNWYAVHDSRGLAPKGFHIPSDAEWKQLSDYLGGQDVAGIKMKNTNGWANNRNGTNTSGFSGLPGGSRNKFGDFKCKVDICGNWWSSTEDVDGLVWARHLDCYLDELPRNHYDKRLGFSVRCIKD